MAENEAPSGIPDPYAQASYHQAAEAGKLLDSIRSNPEEAMKLGVGVAGMRSVPDPEPEPLSKSIQGEIDLSHVMDGIGRLEDLNRQLLQMLKSTGGTRF